MNFDSSPEKEQLQPPVELVASLKKRLAEMEGREALLLAENTLLRQFFDQAPLSYQSLDENGCFLSVNQTWLDVLGYRMEEVIGKNFGNFLHPDWRDHFKENFPRLKAMGEILGVEFQMQKKDGSFIVVSLNGRIGKDHQGQFERTYCIFQDITQQKQAEEALVLSEERWRNVIVSIPQIGICLDPQGKIVFANAHFLQLLGWTEQEVLGRDWFEMFIPDHLREHVRDIFQAVTSRKNIAGFSNNENEIVTRTGELRNVAWSNVLSKDIRGNIINVTCLGIDLTERKKIKEQILAMNSELEKKVEQRTRELQETHSKYLHAEKLSAIGKLSASIAHEFNNPLQGIMTILQGFKRWRNWKEEDKVLLDLAISESYRMKNLIRSLQDFNRPSSGKKILVDVHASIDSLLLFCKNDFKRKKIRTVTNYAESLPNILAISDQIKQVILNLLNNAADACPNNGGVITISTCCKEKRVAIAIGDNGMGIDQDKMHQIFQPFYSTKPAVKGTGLGLSVCNGIVQSHQGEIHVESQPGEGSTFTVLLPIK